MKHIRDFIVMGIFFDARVRLWRNFPSRDKCDCLRHIKVTSCTLLCPRWNTLITNAPVSFLFRGGWNVNKITQICRTPVSIRARSFVAIFRVRAAFSHGMGIPSLCDVNAFISCCMLVFLLSYNCKHQLTRVITVMDTCKWNDSLAKYER